MECEGFKKFVRKAYREKDLVSLINITQNIHRELGERAIAKTKPETIITRQRSELFDVLPFREVYCIMNRKWEDILSVGYNEYIDLIEKCEDNTAKQMMGALLEANPALKFLSDIAVSEELTFASNLDVKTGKEIDNKDQYDKVMEILQKIKIRH